MPTFDLAQVNYDGLAHLTKVNGRMVGPGTGIAIRAERGFTLADDPKLLRKLSNPDGPSGMVVLDTWIRNRDRFSPEGKANYGNLFFSRESSVRGSYKLVAMDHTHCFADQCEITQRIAENRFVRDDRVFGLFKEFLPIVNFQDVQKACERIKDLDVRYAKTVLQDLPREWEVSYDIREAWFDMIIRRAEHVATTLPEKIQTTLAARKMDLSFKRDLS